MRSDAREADVNAPTRREHDLLGSLDVPEDAYYGVHTVRALHNFPISGVPIGHFPHLVESLCCVKEAAARANAALGLLAPTLADAVATACQEIRSGALHEEFRVDVVQGGAGTSTNMNANEVIANRALEILGHPRGTYHVLHPVEHVNLGQSTNDVYPTALRIGLFGAAEGLLGSMGGLAGAFAAKAKEFDGHLKMGRTQLQDAVPMTLGQEFEAYATMVREDQDRLREAMDLILEVNLGGTAIGTGLNAPPGFGELACRLLAEISGVPIRQAPDLIEATQDVGALVHISGTLRRIAVKISKTAHDLRLLSSGPRAGLAEIQLPAVQAGSSIMPGKVNPVIPEVVNQIAYSVLGNDLTVAMAAEAGQLQLNAFEPIIARALFESFAELSAGFDVLARRCIAGITSDPDALRKKVERSIGLATALVPHLGYTLATEVACEAQAGGRTVREVVERRGLLDARLLETILASPEHLVRSTPSAYGTPVDSPDDAGQTLHL